MQRHLVRRIAVGGAAAALALGAVACETDNGDADPGLEGEDDFGDDLGGEDDL
jgi:hypothetical protein